MKSVLHYSVLLLLPTVVLVHLRWAPYTKVEESFNIQAIHDILIHGVPLNDVEQRLAANYDHTSFPGAVPRTFVGALLVAEIARPWTRWLTSPQQLQMLARAVLGLYNSVALLFFQDAVSQAFGRVAGTWYILLQASQFHVMYYASRTLPNMFAFGLTTTALRLLILSSFGPRTRRASRNRLALYLMTVAGVIFRSEIAILLATQCAWLTLIRKVSLREVIIPAGIVSMTAALLVTVSIDSFFWQRFPLWPEWVGFRYNTLQGKSADWGRSPWHFYLLNALPRLMLNPISLLLCLPLALSDPSTQRFSLDLIAPLLAFVALYSCLPHKEWRFIIYTIPGLTAVAAAGASQIWTRRSRSLTARLLALALVASTIASFAVSAGLLAVSALNYPGAAALERLHELAHGERPLIRVHLDDLACQTGVTRFLEKRVPASRRDLKGTGRGVGPVETVWYYDKTEDVELLLDPAFWQRFDYVLAEDVEPVIGKWEIVEQVMGFAGIGIERGEEGAGKVDGVAKGLRLGGGSVYERLHHGWKFVERWLRKNVTRDRWLVVKMEPKIKILRKQE